MHSDLGDSDHEQGSSYGYYTPSNRSIITRGGDSPPQGSVTSAYTSISTESGRDKEKTVYSNVSDDSYQGEERQLRIGSTQLKDEYSFTHGGSSFLSQVHYRSNIERDPCVDLANSSIAIQHYGNIDTVHSFRGDESTREPERLQYLGKRLIELEEFTNDYAEESSVSSVENSSDESPTPGEPISVAEIPPEVIPSDKDSEITTNEGSSLEERMPTPCSSGSTDSIGSTQFTELSLGTMERISEDDFITRFIGMHDLHLTDYFMNVRCICSYTLYSVHFNDFGFRRVANRRYSDFVLYDKVLRENGYQTPVPLPPKDYWNKNQPLFLSQRFLELQQYFNKQLQNPSSAQLLVLQMFLGAEKDSILYLQVVLARTREERAKAVNMLLKFLMKGMGPREEFLSSLLKPPLTSFAQLSPAKKEDENLEPGVDYRLGNELVFDSLLDCLVSCSHRTVCEVSGIFLYMLHHEERILSKVLDARAIRYVTKAISRLLLSRTLHDVAFPWVRFPKILSSARSTDTLLEHAGAWGEVSYFLIMALNIMPHVARSYLSSKGCIESLDSLIDYNDYDVMKRFSIWLLWLCAAQKDLHDHIDRDSVTSVLKKLYRSDNSTLKTLCGLVLVALMAADWFDKESEPRALASVFQLLPCINKFDSFIGRELFSNSSMERFHALLEDTSLPAGARLFLVSVLRTYVMAPFRNRPLEFDIKKYFVAENGADFSELNMALFGPTDPDYRSDLSIENDNTFNQKFASMYQDKLRHISEDLCGILYAIGVTYEKASQEDENGEADPDEQQLLYTTAECLLFLPYNPSVSKEGDYFDVNFNVKSCLAHFRDRAKLKLEGVTLDLDVVNHMSLEDTVVICLDKGFFVRRIEALRVILARTQEVLQQLCNTHVSNNDLPSDCMYTLRRCWTTMASAEYQERYGQRTSSTGPPDEEPDLFGNFAFQETEHATADVSTLFKPVDHVELRDYAAVAVEYNAVQQRLIKLIRFFILYYQACDKRLSVYKSMLAKLETRINGISLENLVEADELEQKLLECIRLRDAFAKEEAELVAKIKENNAMLSRVKGMISNNDSKMEACRKQLAAVQQRIDEIPRIRQDCMNNKNQLDALSRELQESIQSANEKIRELEGSMAHGELLKQDYSSWISQITHVSSVLDTGNTHEIPSAIESITADELRTELKDISSCILSQHVEDSPLDAGSTLKLKRAVLNHLNIIQEKLNSVYASDKSDEITVLNQVVREYEEKLYRVQVDLQNAKRSLIIDSRVLEDSLATHKLMVNNLETTGRNLDAEVHRINDIIRELESQLATVRPQNQEKTRNLENARQELIEMIKDQRKVRLATLHQLLAAEFMCKKIIQEQSKLSEVLGQKAKLLELIDASRAEETASRNKLVKSFRTASRRLQQTAEFLEKSESSFVGDHKLL